MRHTQAKFRLFVFTILLTAARATAVEAQEPTFTVQTKNSTPVVRVSFSRDGRYMVTGSFNGEFKIWDRATGRELRSFGQRFSSLIAGVGAIDISPDSRTVALSSMGKVSLWDISTGREIRSIATDAEGSSVLWDTKGRLVVGSRDRIAVYDLTGNHVAAQLNGVTEAFAVTPDGTKAALVRRNIEIRDMATKGLQAEIAFYPFPLYSAVAFSPDGRTLLSGDANGMIRVYDAATGKVLKVLEEGESVESMGDDDRLSRPGGESARRVKAFSFNSAGDLLASVAEDGEIVVRSWPTGERVLDIKGYDTPQPYTLTSLVGAEGAVRFTPDGEYLAACRGGRAVEFFRLKGVGATHAPPPSKMESFGGSMNDAVRYVGPGKLYSLPGGPTVQFGAGGRWLSVLGMAPFLASLASGEVTPVRRDAGDVLVKLSPDEETGITLSRDNTLHILNFDNETSSPLGVSPAESLISDVSSDGRYLLTASFSGGEVVLWDLRARRKGGSWRLPLGDVPVLSNINSPALLSPDAKTFVSMSGDGVIRLRDAVSGHVNASINGYARPGTGTRFGAFSPDGKTLALSGAGNRTTLWDVGSGTEIKALGAGADKGALITCLTYSRDGKSLYAMDFLFRVRSWDVESGRESQPLNVLAEEHGSDTPAFLTFGEGLPLGMSLSPDGNVLAVNFYRGDTTEVILTDLRRGSRLANLYVKEDGDWLVKTPDGRFDANRLENSELLSGVFPDEPDRALPLDVFLRDYFEPRLLPRLLSGEQLRPVRDISTLNRVQPRVNPPVVAARAGESSAEVTVEVENVKGKTQKDGRALESGVFNVRLFRDGQLVGHTTTDERSEDEIARWRETNRVRLVGGKARLTFNVKLPPGPVGRKVEFSAYAFNSDMVKSDTVRSEYVIRGGQTTSVVPRRAYVVAVGVNKYQNPAWDLRFAANDARLTRLTLSEKLRATGQFSEVVEIPLISDDEAQSGRLVTRREATKANVRSVFDLLAGRKITPERAAALGVVVEKVKAANPDDLVIISFSSHGFVDDGGIFYLLPYDIGEGTSRQVTPEIVSRSISSDELSLWLDGVDAGEMLMIVDACHAAAAVENRRFKPAPMSSGGLARLAYDKGIRILSATQAVNVAVEAGGSVGHGLLTYALMREGLGRNAADFKPSDKEVKLKEWLEYGVWRVPKLYADLSAGRLRSPGVLRDVSPDVEYTGQAYLQQPSLFDFSRRPTDTTLSRIP